MMPYRHFMFITIALIAMDASARPLHGFISLGYSCCGERLDDSQYVLCNPLDNFCSSTRNEYINAGEGADIAAGVLLRLGKIPMEFKLAYGRSTYSDEAHAVEFRKLHIDAMAYFRRGRHRLGAGLSHFFNIDLQRRGGGSFYNTYKDTMGSNFEYGFKVNHFTWFYLRHTIMTLKGDVITGGLPVRDVENIDANNTAFFISIEF